MMVVMGLTCHFGLHSLVDSEEWCRDIEKVAEGGAGGVTANITQQAKVCWVFHLGQTATLLLALSITVPPQLLTTRTATAWKAGGLWVTYI